MSQLDNALDALRRGLRVFPCHPRSKKPAGEAAPNGVKDATADEAQVRRWWALNPDYNPGVTGGTIVDCDKGLTSLEGACNFAALNGLPPTLAVRTGRRDAYGVQFHFTGQVSRSGPYEANGVTGEVRAGNLYGMAPGAIHPDTGESYEIILDLPIAPWPEALSFGLRAKPSEETAVDAETARETFEHLLYDVTHATRGNRNHHAHRCAWFAARAFLADVFEETEAEIKRRILAAVTPLYRPRERDLRRMLQDSWRYGLAKGRLPLTIYHEDWDRLFAVVDASDLDRVLCLLDGVTTGFPCATAARDHLVALLEQAGFDEEGKRRVLRYSRIEDAVAAQVLAELMVEQFVTEEER